MSTSSKINSYEMDDVYILLNSGKEYLNMGDIPNAIEDLSICCEMVSSGFGEMAEECGECYYLYGKALLESSRIESAVLDNALEGIDITAADEESSQIENPANTTKDIRLDVDCLVSDALEENYEFHERIASVHFNEESSSEDESEDEDDSDTSDDVVEIEEVVEEPSDLELAWEMFEVAKIVYTNIIKSSVGENKSEAVKTLSEIYKLLGEVSLENGNWEQAVADINTCLDMEKSIYPSDSRAISATLYQLGVAHSCKNNFVEGNSHYKKAVTVMEERIASLRKIDSSTEIVELESLVSEVKEEMENNDVAASDIAKGLTSGGSKPLSTIQLKNRPDLQSSSKFTGSMTVGSA